MDLHFIQRAEQLTSFNLSTKDFESLKHKKELQYLFHKHFFPGFDLSNTVNHVDADVLNELITQLKSSSKMFPKLHKYNLKGVGPGEATLFFLINTSHLGGGSSAGIDLFVHDVNEQQPPDKYEVKAAMVSPDRVASGFKVGGAVPLSDIMHALNEMRQKLGVGGTRTEISGKLMQKMRERAPKTYREIERHYADLAYDYYFKNHKVIFINNSAGPAMGRIESIKQVAKEDILMERLTNGTVKPRVRL